MVEETNNKEVLLEADPKAIDPNKIKAYALVHKMSPQDAYRTLLATDLLKRVEISNIDTQSKIVLRILISMVAGEGEKDVEK